MNTMKKRNPKHLAKKTIRKMNCTPKPKNVKTPIQDSCYTDDALLKLREEYNKKYPDRIIHSKHPMAIWIHLRNELTDCSTEDCWLGLVSDPETRKKWDERLFAPDRPTEWKDDPNQWLSNFDIMAVLKNYERAYPHFKLLGPTTIDYYVRSDMTGGKCVCEDLCNFSLKKMLAKGKTDFGIIFNLDKHDEPGSHWVSMYVDTKNSLIYYYDSAKNKIPKEVLKFKNELIKQGKALKPPISFRFMKNKKQHQKSNTECGMYSLFFIITFLTGNTEFKKNMTIDEKIQLFQKASIPDKYVEKYRTIYFN
jgi:Ulp1 protease family, C-terminal catalytic domain